MKKILTVVVTTMAFVFSGSAFADSHEGDEMAWFPVEAFACSFKDGAGPEDLDEVVAEWNQWMDENGQGSYFAVTMWPNFYGERAFDFAWLGAWQSGTEMGIGADKWVTEGQEVAAKFWEIIDCSAHTNFATSQLKAPEGEDEDGSFVLSFSDCSFKEDGGGMEAMLEAQKSWNAHSDEHGFVGGTWMMFPVYGENVDADYDFKYVESAPDYKAFGANWQLYSEGHYQESQDLFSPVIDCDSARVYNVNVVREMAEDDE